MWGHEKREIRSDLAALNRVLAHRKRTRELRMLGFDVEVERRARWLAVRRWLVLVAILVAFVEFQGVPHLRMTYVEEGGRVRSGEYWSLMGPRTVVAGDVAPTCPVIALVPLERSLWSYAKEAVGLEN